MCSWWAVWLAGWLFVLSIRSSRRGKIRVHCRMKSRGCHKLLQEQRTKNGDKDFGPEQGMTASKVEEGAEVQASPR